MKAGHDSTPLNPHAGVSGIGRSPEFYWAAFIEKTKLWGSMRDPVSQNKMEKSKGR